MKKLVIALSVVFFGLLGLLGIPYLSPFEAKPDPSPVVVSADKTPPAKPEPTAEPTKDPPAPAPEWELVHPDAWAELLPGKWQGASDKHVSADFEHKRKGSKTPWNVTLGDPNDKGGFWYGCGFYETGVSYCRRPDDTASTSGVVTVKNKADTETIRFNAFNGDFDFELKRVE